MRDVRIVFLILALVLITACDIVIECEDVADCEGKEHPDCVGKWSCVMNRCSFTCSEKQIVEEQEEVEEAEETEEEETEINETEELNQTINETVNETEEPEEPEVFESTGNLTVGFIDVGYGDSIFVSKGKNKTLLIDGGFNDKGPKVIHYMQDSGALYYLDNMILTHPEPNHVGGLPSVFYNYQASIINVYDNGREGKNNNYITYRNYALTQDYTKVTEDIKIDFDDNVDIQLFVPYEDDFLENMNDNSIITKITYGEISFLLTGGCSFACEEKIMDKDINATILKIGHYGANDSSSEQFLSKVSPELAVISAGESENYGCPGNETLARLDDLGVLYLRTDTNGTITIKTDGFSYWIETEK